MLVMCRCLGEQRGKQRGSGAQDTVILGEIELTDAAPCNTSEGQQRVDGQTFEITN